MKAECEPWRARLDASNRKIQKSVKTYNMLAEAKNDSALVLIDDMVSSDELPWDSEPNMPRILMIRRLIVEKVLVWLHNVYELEILKKEASTLDEHLQSRMIVLSDAIRESKVDDPTSRFRPYVVTAPQQPSDIAQQPEHHSRYRIRTVEGAHPGATVSIKQGCRAAWCVERTKVAALQLIIAQTLHTMHDEASKPKHICSE